MPGPTFLMAGASARERIARLGELRSLALVCPRHPLAVSLAAAIADPAATEDALAHLAALPALRRRRLLSAYGALMDA